MRQKAVRRRTVRIGLLLSNVVILGIILAFVLQNPHSGSPSAPAALSSNAVSAVANPLDQVSSTDIAQTVAQMNALPETTAISNQAQSQAAESAIVASNDNVLSKPQVVATALKSRADIQTYTTVAGDTVSGVATKFGITSDSVRWSNGITGDAVAAGTKLTIPPVNGIVYTVKAGDTADSLASKYRSSKDQIIAYNDAEITGLTPGEQIIIPNAVQTAGQTAAGISGLAGGFLWGSGPIYGYNGYDYGYCTWYVATQIAVPANWGNASTWAYYARLSGWNVSHTPTAGGIGQMGSEVAWGQGHVAVVDAVSPDGTQIQYRDMNGLAGWGRVGQSGWVPASKFDNYISH
ncbi:MAG TPA: LysM peptidoglycan-binding domain-containing protein [Candidatus Dormibacteraeota bacterium]|nr:LysM peptidoglycan-binding domain-containing protein [Candidatus Dormibacteraeota bacterium]